MKVIGKTMIFKKEYEGKSVYSTNISNKDMNGEYTNMYISVQLPKGTEIENKTVIDIKNSFLSFYNTKDGLPKIKLVIIKFEFDNPLYDDTYKKEERDAIQNEEFYGAISESDLPF